MQLKLNRICRIIMNNEIERGLKQVQSVKKLIRIRTGFERSEEGKERVKRIPTFIFADKTYADIRTLISNITTFYVSNKVPKQEQFDIIVTQTSHP